MMVPKWSGNTKGASENWEYKPEAGEHKPEVEEHKPEAEEHKPEAGEHKPEAGEHKPEAEEHKPDKSISFNDRIPWRMRRLVVKYVIKYFIINHFEIK